MLLINGHIWTVDSEQPWAEAILIHGNRIVFVGENQEARTLAGTKDKVIDLQGRLVLPGFNDAHVHFMDGGHALIGLRVRESRDRWDFRQQLADYVKTQSPGKWIIGGEWDHEAWPDQTYPDLSLIDDVTPANPLLLHRLDLHVALANSLALRTAGITRDTPAPDGGSIERDENGELTGILKDNAIELVSRHIPELSMSERLNAVEAAMKHANELGVTSVQDVFPLDSLPVYQHLLHEKRLSVRVLAAIPAEKGLANLSEMGLSYRFGSHFLRLGSVKLFSDGSMGAGSALFFDPYSDAPHTNGIAMHSTEQLNVLIDRIYGAGLQPITHAIGDKANRWVLDAYEIAREHYGKPELRPRIEHAQVIHPEDMPRFAELGIIASVQPSHCIDDMRWAEKRIGRERCKRLYPFNSLLRSGAHVAFGTDWPVESLNPMLGLYAAVARSRPDDEPGNPWFPEERITMEQAIRCYTTESAYAEHEEESKGTIQSGKLADLVAMNQNLLDMPPDQILNTKVDLTIVDGKIVFER